MFNFINNKKDIFLLLLIFLGMSMGAQRHVADIKVDDVSQASKATINLQYGQNKGANQSGMSYGGRRDIMGN